jgi:carotenoid 1,2-hydratase
VHAELDPDRFLAYPDPGAHEWWYFDAISDDGRDAVVLIWFSALPFDPAYGLAARRYLASPGRFAAPRGLDHCAVSVNWYRDGRLAAYALNRFRADDFRHTAEPFELNIGGNRLLRTAGRYDLEIDTPALGGGRLRGRFRFNPAAGTRPLERDLGGPDNPHLWILAAPDCRVEGTLVRDRGGEAGQLAFHGRGYHDHNAGSEELSTAMRRWTWGRVQHADTTEVYYHAQPQPGKGPSRSLWITCRAGRPESIREDVEVGEEHDRPTANLYGVRHGRRVRISDGTHGFWDERTACVDDGPFYRRWVGGYRPLAGSESVEIGPKVVAISEILDTRRLLHPLYTWMIPFRLKSHKI